MPILFQYLLKLSVSLGIMYLFYQFVLRRLTFYNHNRWYLAGYSLLCFFISFINISPILEKNEVGSHEIVAFIPAVEMLTTKISPDPAFAMGLGHWTSWSWLLLFLIAGTVIFFLRFAFQLISFKRLTGKARLIADNEIKFYQVNENIIPFSFGNSIFINQRLHTETELKEIIRHEFVHVKQRHTVDIIWSEMLCILNWYNPFAWLIRKSIRQNLEFIADNKVLENGMDKKQYQYLLLKVIGNNHFSIASNFNFSSLKKRIAMMNKIRSAKLHLIKFLFVLPLIAVLLLSFRSRLINSYNGKKYIYAAIAVDVDTKQPIAGVKIKDMVSGKETTSDERGYFNFEFDRTARVEYNLQFLKKGYVKQNARYSYISSIEKGIVSGNMIDLIGMNKGNEDGNCYGCFSGIFSPFIGIPNYEIANDLLINYVLAERNDDINAPYKDWSFSGVTFTCSRVVQSEDKETIRLNGRLRLNINHDAKGLVVYKAKEYQLTEFRELFDSNAVFKNATVYQGKAAFNKYGHKAKNGIILIGTDAVGYEKYIPLDTVPAITKVNDKGYYIDIKDNKGNCMIVVKDKDRKEVKRLLLTEWNKNEKYYKELYGEILTPITITAVPVAEAIPIPQTLQPIQPSQPLPGAQPVQPLQPSQTIRPEPAIKLRNVVSDNDINKPLIIVDGVEWGQEVDVDILDANKIEKVDVMKNGTAANKYGEKGKNGVVIITTKKGTDNPQTSAIRIRGKAGIAVNAIYYVNGKETSKEAVELIDPAKIQSIKVLKGNPAEQKYGEKGKNGVVEIIITGSANSNFIEKPITPAWDIKNFLPGKKKDEC